MKTDRTTDLIYCDGNASVYFSSYHS